MTRFVTRNRISNAANRLANLNSPKRRRYDLGVIEEKLEAQSENQSDALIRGSDLTYHEDGTIEHEGVKFSLTSHSWTQFANVLGIPAAYLRRAQEGGISKDHVDHWLGESVGSAKLLVRLALMDTPDPNTGAEGRVRAVLSSKAAPISNLDIVRTVRPFVKEHGLVVSMATLAPDDTTFHLRLLFPDEFDAGVRPGKGAGEPDPHRIGLHLANSETGARSLTGDMVVFREVCSNGLVALVEQDHLITSRHVGSATDMTTKLRLALERALSRRDDLAGVIREAHRKAVADPNKLLEHTLQAFPKGVLEVAKEAWTQEPHRNVFGVVQAVTRAAQTFGADRRLAMEEAAGRLLLAA